MARLSSQQSAHTAHEYSVLIWARTTLLVSPAVGYTLAEPQRNIAAEWVSAALAWVFRKLHINLPVVYFSFFEKAFAPRKRTGWENSSSWVIVYTAQGYEHDQRQTRGRGSWTWGRGRPSATHELSSDV